MKRILSTIGFCMLICISFVYTEKAANLVVQKDDLMMTINDSSSNYEMAPIDGVINENTFIPGINGIKVNNKESYTQKEVADILGISQSYISRIEKKVIKNIRNLMKI